MAILNNNQIGGASGQTSGGYTLDNSLRFRSSASASLTKTYGTPTNAKIFTLSTWVKRGKLGVFQQLYSGYTDSTNRGFIGFQTGDFLACYVRNSGGDLYEFSTPALFRDPSAWYHIIVAFDTTQATATNRVKVYVNGIQHTLTLVVTTQNVDLSLNTTGSGKALGMSNSLEYLDGYMTEVNFVDGQALTAADFGETNEDTGVWQPKRFTGTYGTNGFYLPMNLTTELYNIDYLVVAGGGGGGGGDHGGGGGAGGLLTASGLQLYSQTTYTVTVGDGGAGGIGASSKGTNGANSIFNGITSTGGGGGGAMSLGLVGGSGGGTGGSSAGSAAGTAGQGNAGGTSGHTAPNYGTGGGGGAGAVGSNGTSTTGGAGGAGSASSITGSSVYRAGGGGGGTWSSGTPGTGGNGGGGAGTVSGTATAGTANTGGGGGAGGGTSSVGGAGGSGVVILSVPTANYSGTTTGSPTVATVGANKILTFIVDGSYTA